MNKTIKFIKNLIPVIAICLILYGGIRQLQINALYEQKIRHISELNAQRERHWDELRDVQMASLREFQELTSKIRAAVEKTDLN
ncbi:hypothetical protein EBB07_33890 [Paenibacillaceae bacterium]|nr:hypothetical protein EBB07_33890 [Paenibacillaceae bacterium]